MVNVTGKTRFTAAYDYGMGGLWGLVWARSPEELRSLYPELAIVKSRPKWMTDELFTQMESRETYDIDEPPRGMLRAVLEARLHD